MRRHLLVALLLPPVLAAAAHASWAFRPSYYSHSPTTGERVNRYAEPAPSYSRVGGENYLQSGYWHNHISIQAGYGADNMHTVETWGEGQWLRPYGEWQFPYRAGATPYGPWGNPQGPWTMPFDSWNNPYGLMQHYPNPYPNYPPYPMGSPMAPGYGGGPYGPGAYQQRSGPSPMMPGYGLPPYGSGGSPRPGPTP